jgi:hypothetical protein
METEVGKTLIQCITYCNKEINLILFVFKYKVAEICNHVIQHASFTYSAYNQQSSYFIVELYT